MPKHTKNQSKTNKKQNTDDTQSHGTHCIGSTLGRTNGIGVAPEATWIACRGLNDFGSGTENDLLDCAQWMLTANPMPNIVTNSWGGGSGDNWYNGTITPDAKFLKFNAQYDKI